MGQKLSYIIILFCFISCTSSKEIRRDNQITKVEIVAIGKLITYSRRLTEENVFKLHKDGVKVILYDKKVIKNIQNQINELKTSEEDCDVEVWLSVLVHYKNDETNYLSFTGYSNFSIIRYGGKCYEWKQELVELFYPYLPKYILDSLPDEIK